jgi:hypothetical protein
MEMLGQDGAGMVLVGGVVVVLGSVPVSTMLAYGLYIGSSPGGRASVLQNEPALLRYTISSLQLSCSSLTSPALYRPCLTLHNTSPTGDCGSHSVFASRISPRAVLRHVAARNEVS